MQKSAGVRAIAASKSEEMNPLNISYPLPQISKITFKE